MLTASLLGQRLFSLLSACLEELSRRRNPKNVCSDEGRVITSRPLFSSQQCCPGCPGLVSFTVSPSLPWASHRGITDKTVFEPEPWKTHLSQGMADCSRVQTPSPAVAAQQPPTTPVPMPSFNHWSKDRCSSSFRVLSNELGSLDRNASL